MGKETSNRIILLILICILSTNLVACKILSIDSYTVSNDTEVANLKKKFRFHKIEHISIYDNHITKIDELLSLLKKNKKGIESILLNTENLNDKYHVLTELKLKHFSISILNSITDTVVFSEWVSNFNVETFSISCGVSKGMSSVEFNKMKELKVLEIGSDSINLNTLKQISSLKKLENLIIGTNSKLNYSSLLDDFQGLKHLSLDLSYTPLDNFPSFPYLSTLTIYNAEELLLKSLDKICYIPSLSIHTTVEIETFKQIMNDLKCHPALMYNEKNKIGMPIRKKG